MGAFDSLLRATIGGADFQLENYGVEVSPVVQENLGRTGTTIRVSGTGWLEADSPSDFVAKLTSTRDGFTVAGQDFHIYGLSGLEEFAILAAQCLDGGPHIGFAMQPQSDMMRKQFSFSVMARMGTLPYTTFPNTSTYKESITAGPDGLRRVSRTGTITQSGSRNYFLDTILPGFAAIYRPPEWAALNYRIEVDGNDQTLSYTISADELRTPFPSGAGSIVSGDAAIRRSRDEQMRLVVSYDFDLLLSSGDYQPVVDVIRRGIVAPGEAPIRESVDVTIHRQAQLRASFEMILGGDGNKLIGWEESFSLDDAAPMWEERKYPGAQPILIKQADGFPRLTQSGRALGSGAYIKENPPLYPDRLCEPPRIEFRRISRFERETRWSYVMLIDDPSFVLGAAALNELEPPTVPQVIA